MKTSFVSIALLFTVGIGYSQDAEFNLPDVNQQSFALREPFYFVGERGPHHRVFQRVSLITNQLGQVALITNLSYVELATGLCHSNALGQWIESKENIDLLPNGGAAATNGQHQVYFPPDIYTGAIQLITPDQKHLLFKPVGLSYFDGTNSVLIADLTNSFGQILPSGNAIIYTNAFDACSADLFCEYTKAGYEENIVLREQPPDPRQFGLNLATTRIQVLTEWFSPPQPGISTIQLPSQGGIFLPDENLSFGAMGIGMGRVFLTENNNQSGGVITAKTWAQLSNRQILVEEVPLSALSAEIQNLPRASQSANIGLKRKYRMASNHLSLPAPPVFESRGIPITRLAKAIPPSPGLVIDFNFHIINGSPANLILQSGATYYVSGYVNPCGSNIVFEGGSVIKYAPGASISIGVNGVFPAVKWTATAFRPVIFTAQDDDSVGETITNSTHNPFGQYYANPALGFLNDSSSMGNVRISFASQAIAVLACSLNISNGQFVSCRNGLSLAQGSWNLRNVLFASVIYPLNNLGYGSPNIQNGTFVSNAAVMTFANSYSSPSFVNCIFADVTNFISGYPQGTYSGNNNGFFDTPTPFGGSQFTSTDFPFQSVGAGNYYLVDISPFRGAGSTSLDAGLLADLKNKTTYPPAIVLSNVTVTLPATWSQQVQRDTGIPDLGFHYDPLDYLVSQVTVPYEYDTSTLWLTNGVAVGVFGGYGFQLPSSSLLMSLGNPSCMNRIAVYSMVQEQPVCIGNPVTSIFYTPTSPANTLTCRFTDFSMWSFCSAGTCYLMSGYQTPQHVTFQDCSIRGVTLNIPAVNMPPAWVTLQNNLIERSAVSLNGVGLPWGMPPSATCYLTNNLFYGGSLALTYNNGGYPTATAWTIYNNSFDTVTNLTESGNITSWITNGYNAYINGSPPLSGGVSNITLGSFAYVPGPLGNYYQPSNSALIDKGCTNANSVGLFQYTVITNMLGNWQIKETNSIVDIGFHYVAVDNLGNPIDSDGDGIPDYLEDSNGNGISDGGDLSDWQLYNSYNVLGSGNLLQVFTPLK